MTAKWTQELRKIMYARVTMEFGSLDSWEGKRHPPCDRDKFDKVMEQLAKYFSILTGKEFTSSAVSMQVEFGATKQKSTISKFFERITLELKKKQSWY